MLNKVFFWRLQVWEIPNFQNARNAVSDYLIPPPQRLAPPAPFGPSSYFSSRNFFPRLEFPSAPLSALGSPRTRWIAPPRKIPAYGPATRFNMTPCSPDCWGGFEKSRYFLLKMKSSGWPVRLQLQQKIMFEFPHKNIAGSKRWKVLTAVLVTPDIPICCYLAVATNLLIIHYSGSTFKRTLPFFWRLAFTRTTRNSFDKTVTTITLSQKKMIYNNFISQ